MDYKRSKCKRRDKKSPGTRKHQLLREAGYGQAGVFPGKWIKLSTYPPCCESCGWVPTPPYRLEIDHDHDTGLIRGFLCSRCNRGLGLLRTPEQLAGAIKYLNRAAADPEGVDRSVRDLLEFHE